MSLHRHLSSEEICERALLPLEQQSAKDFAGCGQCEAEAKAFAQVFAQLRLADAQTTPTTDWDDMLIQGRIREAVSREPLHARSFFGRLGFFRPAFVAAMGAVLAVGVWFPMSRHDAAGAAARLASVDIPRLPAWTPLPDESDDEGLAVLAAWTPNEDELAVARCRGACQSGLSTHEETVLLAASASSVARSPQLEPSPQ